MLSGSAERVCFMKYELAPLSRLVEQFERLPGIGHKTAQRLAFFLLNLPEGEAEKFAGAILTARQKIKYCTVCQNLAEDELCPVCANEARDHSVICVVEEPKDVIALERTGEYSGTYHVLHGAISPLDHIGPEELKIRELLLRLQDDTVREIIMATNASTKGEATAMYLSRLIKPLGVKATRLAYGLPVGSDLEYADEITLSRAMEGRSEL